VKTRTRPVNKEGISRPPNEIKSAVRRTQGIIKIDPQAAKEIAEIDEYSPLTE
jgi:hypothetical protein